MAVTTTAIMREHLKEIIHQAKQIALLEERAAQAEKLAATWEERALKAEQQLADQVDWQLSIECNYNAYKDQERKAEAARNLLERVEYYHDGLFAHTPETGSLILEIIEFLRPGSVSPDLLPAEQREEVAANGR